MEINVLIDEGVAGSPGEGWYERIAGLVLAAEDIGDETEVGVVITGQERIQELNLVHRGIDEPTDVLSFPMSEDLTDAEEDGEMAEFVGPPDGVRHLGEVIISFPQALRQAADEGHEVGREVTILLVHGMLHLLGYDHGGDGRAAAADETEMKLREAAILEMIDESGR
jgi:probable rRNA maturation factor